ncbi:MAG TPA: GntR family transcriptional regulator [Gemmatimonadaceae bacterium]
MTASPQITRSTLASQARRALLERILSGAMPPGERINETRVAEELGVSRTPLREALAALARDGFLGGEPGRGYVVTPLTQAEASELYPILGVLEAAALRLGELGDADLTALEHLNAQLATAGSDPDHAIAANFAWHEQLITTCPNTRLVAMVRALWLQVRRYEYAFFAPGESRVHRSVGLHDGILSALRARDVSRAAELMEAHWMTDLTNLIPRITQVAREPALTVGAVAT